MSNGTLIFVHGTGVRFDGYAQSFKGAAQFAKEAGIAARLAECAWGASLGVEFEGLSLPDPPEPEVAQADAEDYARWVWLLDDPLAELDRLSIRDARPMPPPRPGQRPPWFIAWESIANYQPSNDLTHILRQSGLGGFWTGAWTEIVANSPKAKMAFECSAHEIPEAAGALARALVAQLHVLAVDAGQPGPSRAKRDGLVERLLWDWNQRTLGAGTFFTGLLARMATNVVRRHRHALTRRMALLLGDILLYQSRGTDIRAFLRETIGQVQAEGPVTLVGHSLGGIACVDLLALPDPPPVHRLITVGSQAPMLYELGALTSLRPPVQPPASFPPWLNVYDRDDPLSSVGSRLFDDITDFEMVSGQPFPDSHSAYFSNDAMWRSIHDFLS